MKLIRFGEPGAEKPGVLLEHGTRIDVSRFGRDYDEEFFGGGEIVPSGMDEIALLKPNGGNGGDEQWDPPIAKSALSQGAGSRIPNDAPTESPGSIRRIVGSASPCPAALLPCKSLSRRR